MRTLARRFSLLFLFSARCVAGTLATDALPGGSDAAVDGRADAADAVARDGGGDCAQPPPGAPARDSYPFQLNGQLAWSHDEGSAAGYFHTFDALDVGAAGDLPHKVHVLLPRDYRRCDPGYPVVYMNDGDTAFWPGGAAKKSWRVQNVLAALYAANALRKVLVVAIVPVDRNAEYSHVQAGPNQTCCGADRYANYVATRVRGFIDQSYRTQTGPQNTVILGSSRGGLSAFYLATRRPDAFGRAGSMSPSFWAGLDPVYGGTYPGGPLSTAPLLTPIRDLLSDRVRRPRLWIDWGLIRTGGTQNSAIEAAATTRGREMVQLLKDTYGYRDNVELFWQEDPFGEHDEDSWGRRLPEVLKALVGR